MMKADLSGFSSADGGRTPNRWRSGGCAHLGEVQLSQLPGVTGRKEQILRSLRPWSRDLRCRDAACEAISPNGSDPAICPNSMNGLLAKT